MNPWVLAAVLLSVACFLVTATFLITVRAALSKAVEDTERLDALERARASLFASATDEHTWGIIASGHLAAEALTVRDAIDHYRALNG